MTQGGPHALDGLRRPSATDVPEGIPTRRGALAHHTDRGDRSLSDTVADRLGVEGNPTTYTSTDWSVPPEELSA